MGETARVIYRKEKYVVILDNSKTLICDTLEETQKIRQDNPSVTIKVIKGEEVRETQLDLETQSEKISTSDDECTLTFNFPGEVSKTIVVLRKKEGERILFPLLPPKKLIEDDDQTLVSDY